MQFSGTGNTYQIALYLQKQLIAKGHHVDLYPIEKARNVNQLVKSYDCLGIGYPIYVSDMPLIVKELTNNLEVTNNKRAFVFCTQYLFSGDGAALAAHELKKKGYLIRQLAHFNMPNNVTDTLGWLPKPNNLHRLLSRKRKQVSRFVNLIDQNKKRLKGMNIFSRFLGLMQRGPFQKLESSYFSHAIKIEAGCILCGRCVELCPTKNLEIDSGVVKENDRCQICYRCVNHCPVQVLHIDRKHLVKWQYYGPHPDFSIDVVKHANMHEQIDATASEEF
jgi:ferredoxin